MTANSLPIHCQFAANSWPIRGQFDGMLMYVLIRSLYVLANSA